MPFETGFGLIMVLLLIRNNGGNGCSSSWIAITQCDELML